MYEKSSEHGIANNITRRHQLASFYQCQLGCWWRFCMLGSSLVLDSTIQCFFKEKWFYFPSLHFHLSLTLCPSFSFFFSLYNWFVLLSQVIISLPPSLSCCSGWVAWAVVSSGGVSEGVRGWGGWPCPEVHDLRPSPRGGVQHPTGPLPPAKAWRSFQSGGRSDASVLLQIQGSWHICQQMCFAYVWYISVSLQGS